MLSVVLHSKAEGAEKMFQGKRKAVTFSYDDGITQDRRLVKILNRYGLKCTFNINGGLFGRPGALRLNDKTVAHVRMRGDEAAQVYAGHEVAAHSLDHPNLKNCTPQEVYRQVESDRQLLSALVGYPVTGFAYPGGTGCMDDAVVQAVRKTGVQYARTTTSTYRFDLPQDLFVLDPTVYHMEKEKMWALAKQFVDMDPDTPQLFYIWGHAYELDTEDDWAWFEDFCAFLGGRDDIFYGTNRQVLGLE